MLKLIFLCAAAIAVTPAFMQADEIDDDNISRLLSRGEILPLATILEIVRPVTGTQILDVEAEHEDFGMAYEIYFLDAQGQRREINVDARTGEILTHEQED